MTSPRVLHQLLSDDLRALNDCMTVIREGDELLLVDQGVQLLIRRDEISAGFAKVDFPVQLSALAGDIAARGLGHLADLGSVKLLDDGQWVEEVCRCDQVLSWK